MIDLTMIDKHHLLQTLRHDVTRDLDGLIRRQQDTQEAATHQENRAEHSKDTRATEQSYLARGLATRVHEMRFISDLIGKLELTQFRSSDAIAISALVVLRNEDQNEAQTWWLVPGAGGFKLMHEQFEIRTLTPTAPLGRALIGLCVGDEASFETPAGRRTFEVLEIA